MMDTEQAPTRTPLSLREKPAALDDVVCFNQTHVSGWHRWMVGIIHEMAPNLQCHAKAMLLVWDRDSVLWGSSKGMAGRRIIPRRLGMRELVDA